MKKRSKRYKLIEKKKIKEKLALEKSLDLLKETCTSKIDESVDLSIRINTKQSKGGDFNLRTVVKLPHGSGKKFKVAVLCEQEKVEAAKLKSGSSEPGRVVAGSITMKQAEAIAKEKMKDLNAFDLKEATKIICGSARSMGIEVKE